MRSSEWYVAHVVVAIYFTAAEQTYVPVYENCILIEAASPEEAETIAEKRGREYEDDDGGSLKWGGRPATMKYVGLRKLISCQDSDERPRCGTEVTYTQFDFSSQQDLDAFLREEAVQVTYES
jgi:hypothetical protein